MTTQITPRFNSTFNIEEQLNLDTLGLQYGIAPEFDFATGQFVLENGNIKFTDELRAVQQWIANTLIIEKGIFPIYSPTYGTYVYNLNGKGFPKTSLEVMVPDMIREELLKDGRIVGVDQFNIYFENEYMFIEFRVTLSNSITFNHDSVWII